MLSIVIGPRHERFASVLADNAAGIFDRRRGLTRGPPMIGQPLSHFGDSLSPREIAARHRHTAFQRARIDGNGMPT